MKNKEGMKKSNHKKSIIIAAMIIIVLVAGFYLITGAITKYTGYLVSNDKESDFEKCLDEKGITLYINSNNPAETLKQIELNSYLNKVDIVNCIRNNEICIKKGVSSFPTWVIGNNKVERDILIFELVKFSGCRQD